jgi:hypothetical protein
MNAGLVEIIGYLIVDTGIIICPLFLCKIGWDLKNVAHQDQDTLNGQIGVFISLCPFLYANKLVGV